MLYVSSKTMTEEKSLSESSCCCGGAGISWEPYLFSNIFSKVSWNRINTYILDYNLPFSSILNYRTHKDIVANLINNAPTKKLTNYEG